MQAIELEEVDDDFYGAELASGHARCGPPSCGAAVAGLNPAPGHKEPPESVAGDEAPSAAAELWVMKVPAGDQPASTEARPSRGTGNPSGRIVTVIRTIGIAAGLRVTVPSRDAAEMISMIRCVIIAFIWGATAVGTLAIASTAGLPPDATVGIVVLELAGFLFTVYLTRRRHNGKKQD